jgi:hypothetical protein
MFNAVFDELIDKGISSNIDKTEEEIAEQESQDIINKRLFTAYTTRTNIYTFLINKS